MTTDLPTTRRAAIDALTAAWSAEALAAAIVDALTPAGSEEDWDSDTIEYVLDPLMVITRTLGWPVEMNGAEKELTFWTAILDSTL